MNQTFEASLMTEEGLTYYKAHNSIQDVYSNELAYSLIFDNIHPGKVANALATVGLCRLPNRFFLIQVDDYRRKTSEMQLTQECYQKTTLINALRNQLQKMELKGLIGNLIGLEQFICFLCCEEQENDEINNYLMSVAQELKACSRAKGPYTLSLCISERCRKMTDYSRMVPRMNFALSESYFRGKEFVMFMEDSRSDAVRVSENIILNEFYPEVLSAVSQRNNQLFDHVLQRISSTLLKSHIPPQKAQLKIIRLIQRVEAYCVRCGVPEKLMLDFYEETTSHILATSFIADACVYFRDYFIQASEALERYSSGEERTFIAPVKEYISEHYQQPLLLNDLAVVMGFSEGYFARMFRKNFGNTFVEYLTAYRIDQSKSLLTQSHISIEQIAYRVGFNSYSYFCTRFKRACGISPGAYRSKCRES